MAAATQRPIFSSPPSLLRMLTLDLYHAIQHHFLALQITFGAVGEALFLRIGERPVRRAFRKTHRKACLGRGDEELVPDDRVCL